MAPNQRHAGLVVALIGRFTLIVTCLLAGTACGPSGQRGGDSDATNDRIDARIGPEIDAGTCGAQTQMIGVENLGDPPDLLIVLDRSGSMVGPPLTFPPIITSKWQIMRTSLNTVVGAQQQNIRFGLLEFPSDDLCAADATAEVPIGLGNAPAIATYFTGRGPTGNTPAHIGLASALAYYNTITVNSAGRYVLFATDGEPNCNGGVPDTASNTETVAAVTSLFNAGIKTFVVGFGFLGGNVGVLNDAAVAGGEPLPGAKKFYEANDAAQLQSALQQIAGGIIVPSCSYELASAPPDPNNVTVTLNGTPVPRSPSHANGWDYHPDAMTITFFGTYCTQITSGTITDVNFVYGCPGPVVL